MKLRDGFTMIELMVTVVLSMIFLNFIFTFLSNFVSEVRYLYIKEQLAIKSFRLSQIHTRGFKEGDSYVSGIVSLSSLNSLNNKIDDKNFMANFTANGAKEIKITNDNGYTKIDNYTYRELITNDTFKLKMVANNLYSIEFDGLINNLEVNSAIGNATIKYQKLVYTK